MTRTTQEGVKIPKYVREGRAQCRIKNGPQRRKQKSRLLMIEQTTLAILTFAALPFSPDKF